MIIISNWLIVINRFLLTEKLSTGFEGSKWGKKMRKIQYDKNINNNLIKDLVHVYDQNDS